jgi:hypothetical protein
MMDNVQKRNICTNSMAEIAGSLTQIQSRLILVATLAFIWKDSEKS